MRIPLGLKGAIIIIQNNNKSNYNKWSSEKRTGIQPGSLVNLIYKLSKLVNLCLSVLTGKMGIIVEPTF